MKPDPQLIRDLLLAAQSRPAGRRFNESDLGSLKEYEREELDAGIELLFKEGYAVGQVLFRDEDGKPTSWDIEKITDKGLRFLKEPSE